MVMLHLLQQCGYTLGIAHIDHNTRAGQSTDDAVFVKSYAEQAGIPFFGYQLSDADVAHGNFQANARATRYRFMKLVLSEHNYHYICTAHHLDDKWETMIFALTRAAGLAGLTSLRDIEGSVLRPLLPYRRSQLEDYAKQHSIAWREDSSNSTDSYDRNKIRHHITPAFTKVFPQAVEQAVQSAHYLEADRQLLQELLHLHYQPQLDAAGKYYDMTAIRTLRSSTSLLYHLLMPLCFSLSDCKDVLSCSTTGAVFYSDEFELLYDRDRLYMRPIQEAVDWQVPVTTAGIYECRTERVEVAVLQEADSDTIAKSRLVLRPWRAGDRFRPTGMQGKTKTVKALLSDLKYTRWQKEKVVILASGDTVLSVVGVRDSVDLTEAGLVVRLL